MRLIIAPNEKVAGIFPFIDMGRLDSYSVRNAVIGLTFVARRAGR